jgi:hypothetical protein
MTLSNEGSILSRLDVCMRNTVRNQRYLGFFNYSSDIFLGPIIRISPNELHVNDPAFIDTLYAGGGKQRDKYKYFTAQFGYVI